MLLVTERQKIMPPFGVPKEIRSFIEQNKRTGLILSRDNDSLAEQLRKTVQEQNGQFLSLNLPDFAEISFAEILTAALDDAAAGQTFRINVPLIRQNSPQTNSPFVNRAILWERLCDKVILNETPERPAVLLLENIDAAGKMMQHDIARQIRFHIRYRIRRTFLLTADSASGLEPELKELVEKDFNL
ncbi:MAG: hypothetical protein LBN39_09395 [Planctomycetaceae bacterium]|jgi:hypothetical protein|nr:hypothetical protein [Planctomycetaceae bacterium]